MAFPYTSSEIIFFSMFKLIEKLRSKPSDRNIRLIRIVFALVLLGVIYFGLSKTTWNYMSIPKEALYMLYVFPAIGLIRGLLDPGVFRRKVWKWTQVGLGVAMLIITLALIETDTSISGSIIPSTPSWEISATSVVNTSGARWAIDTDFWVGFMGFWLALAGLTLASKNITTKNERYGEKVTKIRV
jgi:hypothetical protein